MLALVFGVVCGAAARNKGRSARSWSVLGFLLGPLALLAIVAIAPRTAGQVETEMPLLPQANRSDCCGVSTS